MSLKQGIDQGKNDRNDDQRKIRFVNFEACGQLDDVILDVVEFLLDLLNFGPDVA